MMAHFMGKKVFDEKRLLISLLKLWYAGKPGDSTIQQRFEDHVGYHISLKEWLLLYNYCFERQCSSLIWAERGLNMEVIRLATNNAVYPLNKRFT